MLLSQTIVKDVENITMKGTLTELSLFSTGEKPFSCDIVTINSPKQVVEQNIFVFM